MKSTILSLALFAMAAAQHWDDVQYGRRTNFNNKGAVGPKGDMRDFGTRFTEQQGNYQGWNENQQAQNQQDSQSWYEKPEFEFDYWTTGPGAEILNNSFTSGNISQPNTAAASQSQPQAQPEFAPHFAQVEMFNADPDLHKYGGSLTAICELSNIVDNVQKEHGLVELMQNADESTKVKIRFYGLTPGKLYDLRIHEFGNVLGESCDLIGDVFDPEGAKPQIMYAYDQYGRKIPLQVLDQSQSKGKFQSIESDVFGEYEVDDVDLWQNLAGDNSLVGRSMALYEKDDNDALACGVIGYGLPWGVIEALEDEDAESSESSSSSSSSEEEVEEVVKEEAD